MDIEDLEDQTFLYIRYRCNAGEFVPPKDKKLLKS